MFTRTFRRFRALTAGIPLVTAALVGGVLTAGPASAVDTGEVTYKGTVTCDKAFPAPNKSVPQRVALDSDEDDAAVKVTGVEGRRARYEITKLEVPLDSNFNLAVTVTCKPPRTQAQVFTKSLPQADLTENQTIRLNIK
ncbi:hypothetical protein QQY24_29975 [Streptomyces sp. TG1A-8]|uniref:hypothetical protein n=1 Tax=Streptomyces sp. TG1A-8 TaxID=3051385 RepID=UPI00265BDD04|nr:hypothetical protein [Streptomyces sp. TG1A-8]MDO0929433.1 hypothetical protein [Streptomyces sp. TG1A-8]